MIKINDDFETESNVSQDIVVVIVPLQVLKQPKPLVGHVQTDHIVADFFHWKEHKLLVLCKDCTWNNISVEKTNDFGISNN